MLASSGVSRGFTSSPIHDTVEVITSQELIAIGANGP